MSLKCMILKSWTVMVKVRGQEATFYNYKPYKTILVF